MAYDFTKLKEQIGATETWLTEEYFGIRTGRATPTLLDSIKVDAYDSKMPINQLANITVENARTLRIVPFDASVGKNIERAIGASNLGISVGVDEKGIRISFPELTSERRAQLLKLVHEKLEDARIAIKKEREEVWDDIQKQEKTKEITEDEKFRAKDELQKIVDEGNQRLEEIAGKKESEISQ